jgi:hypothetical protein
MNDIIKYLSKIGNSFRFNGKKLSYFLHPYNKTWRNERAIEIPIVAELTKDYHGNTLEVGNVTQNYFSHFGKEWDIVDKWEKAPHVINQDIIDYSPKKKYDKIIAISTLEHCGEDIDNLHEGAKAIKKLKTLVAPMGILIITIPAGFNKIIDKDIQKVGLDIYCLKQTNHLWEQCTLKDLDNIEYDYNEHTAKGLYVCVWKNTALN